MFSLTSLSLSLAESASASSASGSDSRCRGLGDAAVSGLVVGAAMGLASLLVAAARLCRARKLRKSYAHNLDMGADGVEMVY